LAWIEKELGPDYGWPGNVRELEQCVRNVLVRKRYRPAERKPERHSSIKPCSTASSTPKHCSIVTPRSFTQTRRATSRPASGWGSTAARPRNGCCAVTSVAVTSRTARPNNATEASASWAAWRQPLLLGLCTSLHRLVLACSRHVQGLAHVA